MANGSIYDIARIAAGDPEERVGRGAAEASAQLEQYSHQKEIIEDINRQMAEAAKRAKKDKGLFGLGGSLLSGLLGLGLSGISGGALAPWVVGALSGGIGSGVAEKARQDQTRATAPLKALEAKYKGRKQIKGPGGVTETREQMQDSLEKMLMMDAGMGAAMGALPGTEVEGGGLTADQGMSWLDPTAATRTVRGPMGIPQMFKDTVAKDGGLGATLANMFTSSKLPEDAFKGLSEMNVLNTLIKSLTPGAVGYMQEDDPMQIDPMRGPQFRNPYRG